MSRFSPYQKRLFVFLSVAGFFDGYDLYALSQLLPELRRYFGAGEGVGGTLVSVINVGTILAYFLVRAADRWGRKRVLTWTILGYTLTTFCSGLAPDLWTFGALQLLGRFFLLAEAGVAMIVIAEEFPARDRGLVLGVVAAITGLGTIACVGVAPMLLKTALGWRAIYLTSALPLLLVAWARRGLRETERFEQVGRAHSAAAPERSLFRIWGTPHRRRAAQLGMIWLVAYIAPQTAIIFWKEFAVHERGFTNAQVAQAIGMGAVLAIPLNFFVGKLMDVVGRRNAAAIVFSACSVGTFLAYSLHGFWPLAASLVLAVFGVASFYPILNAFNTELFPTELRADAYGWCNNIMGRVGYVLAPAIVGSFAADVGWGAAIRPVAILPLVALVLVYWLLPETARKELEETSPCLRPARSESSRVAEKPRTGTLVWTGLAVTWLVLLFVGGTIQPGGMRVSFTVWDKLGHFVGFGVLAALWVAAAERLGARGFSAYRFGIGISSLAGALLELWQYFLPHRSFEVLDWVADTIGAIVAALVVHSNAGFGSKPDAPESSGE